MIIHDRLRPELIDPGVAARVDNDVRQALNAIVTVGDRFVVNDTLWFGKRPNGNITPSVMNSAGLLSGTFQRTLERLGWTREANFDDQVIDNFISLDVPGTKFRIPPDSSFIEFFGHTYARAPTEDMRKEFLRCWHNFVRVGIDRLEDVDEEFSEYFQQSGTGTGQVRIGLEFETGNIASSFRALGKLETLFIKDQIDYGIFITSIDKANAATRIWPMSNRNGSFEELDRRNYRHNLTVPLWEYGFEPDEFDQAAPYFNPTTTYTPVATGRTLVEDGVTYEVFLRGQEELLLPSTPR